MTVLLAILALAGPGPGNEEPAKRHERPQRCHAECRAWRRCNNGSIAACIRRAALKYEVSQAMLHRKAWCESRMNPGAHNPSGASGLFQFLPSTWATTPYRARSIWMAKWNALAAGWMHRVGRGGEWVCQ